MLHKYTKRAYVHFVDLPKVHEIIRYIESVNKYQQKLVYGKEKNSAIELIYIIK